MTQNDKTLRVGVIIDPGEIARAQTAMNNLVRSMKEAAREISKVWGDVSHPHQPGASSVAGSLTGQRPGTTAPHGTRAGGIAGPLLQGMAAQTRLVQEMSRTQKKHASEYVASTREMAGAARAMHSAEIAELRKVGRAHDELHNKRQQYWRHRRRQTGHGQGQVHVPGGDGGGRDGGVPPSGGVPDAPPDQPSRFRQGMGHVADWTIAAGMSAHAIGAGLSTGGAVIQGLKTHEIGARAQIAQATSGKMLRNLLRGDTRDLFYLANRGGTTAGTDVLGQFAGDKALKTELGGNIGSSIGSALTGVGAAIYGVLRGGLGTVGGKAESMRSHRPGVQPTLGDIGAMTGGIGSSAMQAYKGIAGFQADLSSGEVAAMTAGLELTKAANPLKEAIFDTIASQRGVRLAGSRALAGRHVAAQGVGASRGFTWDQSVGTASGIRSAMGLQGMFADSVAPTALQKLARVDVDQVKALEARGAEALKAFDVKRNRPRSALERAADFTTGAVKKVTGGRHDPRADLAQEAAWELGAETSAIDARRSMMLRKINANVTQGGPGTLQMVQDLENMGISKGVATGSVGAISQAFGVNTIDNQNAANQAAWKAMAQAVSTGFENGFYTVSRNKKGQTIRTAAPQLMEELIGFVAQNTSGQMYGQDTSSIGMLANLFTGGTTGQQTLANVQGRKQAIGVLDNMYSNNSYFGGVAAAQAVTTLGPGADGADQIHLAGLTISELAAGGVNVNRTFGFKGTDDAGSARVRAMAIRNRVNAFAKSSGTTSNDFQRALQAAGGDPSQIPEKDLMEIFKNVPGLGKPTATKAIAQLVRTDFTPGTGNFDPDILKKLSSVDAMARDSVAVEERTKMELLATEAGKAISTMLAQSKTEIVAGIVERMSRAEEDGGMGLEKGRQLVVQIVGFADELDAAGRETSYEVK